MVILEVIFALLTAMSFGYQVSLIVERLFEAYVNHGIRLRLGIQGEHNSHTSSTNSHAHSSAPFILVSAIFRGYAALPAPPKVMQDLCKPTQTLLKHYNLAVDSTDSLKILFWQIITALSLAVLLGVFFGPLAVFIGPLLLVAPALILKGEYKNQQKIMRSQLIDLVEELSDSLKANKSFAQALQMCVAQMQLPMKAYVEKAIALIACGISADEAFSQGMEEVFVSEAQTLSAALQVQYRTGGNLMVLLTEFASQFRQTLLFEQNLQTQTAQGRLSVKVVAIIPPILIAIMSLISPGYLNCFFSSPLGRGLFVGAIFLDLCGLLLVNKMMSISEM